MGIFLKTGSSISITFTSSRFSLFSSYTILAFGQLPSLAGGRAAEVIGFLRFGAYSASHQLMKRLNMVAA